MRTMHRYSHTAKRAISGLLFCFSVQAYAGLQSPSTEVVLIVSGAIEQTNVGLEAHFDMQMINDFPVHTMYTQTLVTDGVKRFDGVLMRDLFTALGVNEQQVTQVIASALNDYAVTIPLADFYDYDVLIATRMDGVALQPTDKGPLWIVYPRDEWHKLKDIRYDYRWVWHLNRLHIR